MTFVPRLAALLLLIATPIAARAAMINVPAGDEAALITAIDTANTNGEDDTIALAAGSTYTFTAVNNGVTALPVVTTRITIQGNDAVVERGGGPEFRLIDVGSTGDLTLDHVTVRGGQVTFTSVPPPFFRDGGAGIRVVGSGKLSLANAVVTGNTCTGPVCFGGGIFVQDDDGPVVTLVDSEVSQNFAESGGGICMNHNDQTLHLTRTTIRGNSGMEGGGIGTFGADTITITDSLIIGNSVSAPGVQGGALGGGLLDVSGATWTISGTTITGNSASGANVSTGATNIYGGGMAENGGATITIVNSTITGNSLTNTEGGLVAGAGLFSEGGGDWTLNNVTVSGNTITASNGSGGGMEATRGTFTLQNSIVYGNTAATNPDCSALGANMSNPIFDSLILTTGHNIVGDTTGCAGFVAATGDQIGVDPLLGPLGDNGGPTHTQALLAGSPALDKGDPAVPGSGGTACEAVDQRGTSRPQGTACDIGAFEVGGPTPTTTTTLPGGCPGTRAPTYVSIDCRLDALIADIESAQDLGKVKAALLRSATVAREKKVAAENTDPTNTKKQKKLLKKSIRKMISFGFRIRSRNAVRQVPDAARRTALRTIGAEIQADMKTLMSSL
ncbi:MAG TPA: right-handed parallel beta-helix repeat-containing protein [Candidatus Binatia bacterium]|jgi:hypothetical protein|nr:right-handed parallel beta-helix repeat-containing protein [Candidatus Binatia bacterium]